MLEIDLVGRAGLAAILGISEAQSRTLQLQGEITPAARVGQRDLFNVADAVALRAKRDARRAGPPVEIAVQSSTTPGASFAARHDQAA